MANITVLGLGIIGGTWAGHYREDGHTVRTWNRTPKAEEPGFFPDACQAVEEADVVHLCLAGPPSVSDVLNSIKPALKPGRLVIQSSTISPRAAQSFEALVTATGAAYLEAPFTGSKPAAEARQLVFFTGGEDSIIERARGVLTPLSRLLIPFSSPAKAAAIKLSMNLQIAAISQALSEGYHLARQHGISSDDFFNVLDHNVAKSGLADLKREKLKNQDYRPQFSIKHMSKDLKLALEASEGLPLRLTETVAETYAIGLEEGWGDLDFIALEQLIASA